MDTPVRFVPRSGTTEGNYVRRYASLPLRTTSV